jgi:light-regulated signal transduction histidine kinase (bacteriophytochrome)
MNEAELKNFLRATANDMKNSVGASAALSQMVLDEYSEKLDAKAIKWLSLIKDESIITQNKLKGLSQFAHLFDYKVQFQKCSLARIVNECTETHADLAHTILELSQTPAQLPEIVTSHHLITLFFSELISNSIQHAMPLVQTTDKRLLKIQITYTKSDTEHEISFQDNGQSLKLNELSLIKAPFKIMHAQKIEAENSGLGLSKVMQISRILGGELDLELGNHAFPGLKVVLRLPI